MTKVEAMEICEASARILGREVSEANISQARNLPM